MFENLFDVNVTKDLTDKIKKDLEELAHKQILCGIPDSTEHKDSHISNAQLLFIHTEGVRDSSMKQEMQHNIKDGKTYSQAHEMFIHEHGSALYRIPSRPVLIPAMTKYGDEVAKKMKSCLDAVLDSRQWEIELNKTALFVQNKVRKFFTDSDNGWAPNAESTIKGWQSPWGTFYGGKGSSQPLIDTGELRRSIVGIVGDKRD